MVPFLRLLLTKLHCNKSQYNVPPSVQEPLAQEEAKSDKDKKQMHGSLWRHPNFLRLWTGETISLFGTQITNLALPTVAILLLHADAFSVGLLLALQQLAYLFVGPFAGVFADRLPRRRIMIIADCVRLIALGSIPLLFTLGIQTMLHLYTIAVIVNIFTVFFDVSYQSYLPSLIDRSALVEGNAKLSLADGAAQVGGPAISGLLIQWIGAASAIGADACSYLASALFLISIKKPDREPAHHTQEQGKGIIAEILEGGRLVFHHPVLRSIAIVNTAQNFGASMTEVVALLFAYQRLHLSPAEVGGAMGIGSVGFLLGVVLASPLVRKLGLGPGMSVACFIGAISPFFIPLGLWGLPIVMITLWRFLYGLHVSTYDINQVSLRQALTSDRFQGRMNATFRTMSWGALGLGPLVGGLLGGWLGLVPTILVSALIFLIGSLPILARPVMVLKEQPAPVQ